MKIKNEVIQFFHVYSSFYVFVFTDCIPVQGAKQSAIYDITRGKIYFMPSEYYVLYDLFKSYSLKDIHSSLGAEQQDQLYEFVDFLLKNELAILTECIPLFQSYPERWECTAEILNAIIDVDNQLHNFENIFSELSVLGCTHVQLRFFNSDLLSLDEISEIINSLYHKSIVGVDLILKYNHNTVDLNYAKFYENHADIIYNMVLHTCPEDKIIEVDWGIDDSTRKHYIKKIYCVTQKIYSCDCCGIINNSTIYISSVNDFMHNKLYNSCLNKKISIDKDGNIKNCPSMKNSYGCISHTTLKQALEHPQFKKYWNLNKDQIEVCKDCELRYACNDCRAYRNNDALNSKPRKCNYDPYKAIWENEE